MRLLDQHLPTFQFNEIHSLDVNVDIVVAMNEIIAYRPEEDAFFRCAIKIRELPMRLANHFGKKAKQAPEPFGFKNFVRLQPYSDKEVIYALAGKPWKADFGQIAIADAQALRDFNEPGSVKLVLGVLCEPLASGFTRITTETRIHCLDAEATRNLRPYWYLIRSVSGLIRRRMLKAIARRCAIGGRSPQ